MTTPTENKIGRVFLVGAGPGDPGLLTLRGRDLLARADVVLFDYLVHPDILQAASPHADLHCLGRHGVGRLWSQEEINRALVEHAGRGRQVVRLKAGDPMVFGRVAEEMTALQAANVPFEIVPGISAGAAVAAYAGLTITHRDTASAVAFVTGQQAASKGPGDLDYKALAAFPGTLVFYMGITTATEWSHRLMEEGKDPKTPVTIVRHVSQPRQKIWQTSLADVAAIISAQHIRPPALILVGESVRENNSQWFTARPLFGQSILVTRPTEQAGETGNDLAELGAEVLYQPVISIEPPDDWNQVDQAIARLPHWDWLVFSSVNGVRYFIDRLFERGGDLRDMGSVSLAAIGPATAAALSARGLRADVIPESFRAEDLAQSLADVTQGKNVLLLRASRGRDTLPDMLKQSGATVEQTVVYSSRDVQKPAAEIATALEKGEIDWITVTSSSSARALAAMFPRKLNKCRLAAISPITAQSLKEVGVTANAVAEDYTSRGLIEAIVQAVD